MFGFIKINMTRVMKKILFTFMAATAISLLSISISGCSKVAVYTCGEDHNTGGPGTSVSLVDFHASVESRNMFTRSMTPLSLNVRARVFAYNSSSGSVAGTPVATGEYESLIPGSLNGIGGYKMYIPNGLYYFYCVSENLSYPTGTFVGGQSRPLFNGIDYLWWSGPKQEVTASQINVPILLLHSCAQVVFEVTGGTGITINEILFANISAPAPGAIMNLATGVIPPAATYDTRRDKMGINGMLVQYIVLPLKTTVPMQADFEVRVNGESGTRTYQVEIPVPDGQLAAGNSYRFKAVIQASDVEFPEVDVKDWVDVDETGKPLYTKP